MNKDTDISKEILEETSIAIVSNNGDIKYLIKKYKNYIKEYPNFKSEIKSALIILEEIDRLKAKAGEKRWRDDFMGLKRKQVYIILTVMVITILAFGSSNIYYKINGETKLTIGENETIVSNILRGNSPLQILQGWSLINENLDTQFSVYQSRENCEINNMSSVFNNSMIFETDHTNNIYGMEVVFWDKQEQNTILVLDQGAIGNARASTHRGSMMVIGTTANYPDDENLTLCGDKFSYIDCNSSATGADFGIEDDLEVGGDIYVGGNLNVDGVIAGTLSLGSTNVNISSGNITYETFYMGVLGEGGIADDLDNIIGGSNGDVINIFPLDSGSDIKLKHGTGNLDLNGADCNLKSLGDKAELRKDNGGWKLITCIT